MADSYINLSIIDESGGSFDLSPFIDRHSFSFGIEPRRRQVIQTMDGVDHIAGGGYRQKVTFTFNPLTREQVTLILTELFAHPAFTVSMRGLLPSDTTTNYNMRLDELSAVYLSRCLFRNLNWYQLEPITFVEL